MALTESSQNRLWCLQHLQKGYYEEQRWCHLGSDHPHSKLFSPATQEAPLMSWPWRGWDEEASSTQSFIPHYWTEAEMTTVGDKDHRMVIWCHLGTSRPLRIQRKIVSSFQVFGNYRLALLLLNLLPLYHLFPWLLTLHITVCRCTCFSCPHHKGTLLPKVMCFAHSVPLGRCWEGSLTLGTVILLAFPVFPFLVLNSLDVGHGPGFFSLDTHKGLDDSKSSGIHLLVPSWTRAFSPLRLPFLSRPTEELLWGSNIRCAPVKQCAVLWFRYRWSALRDSRVDISSPLTVVEIWEWKFNRFW